MKFLVIALVNGYQLFISQPLHQLLGLQSSCRYPQTCSSFAKEAIETQGIVKGGLLALRRFLNCQPFGKISLVK